MKIGGILAAHGPSRGLMIKSYSSAIENLKKKGICLATGFAILRQIKQIRINQEFLMILHSLSFSNMKDSNNNEFRFNHIAY